jgi:hypothetical protein
MHIPYLDFLSFISFVSFWIWFSRSQQEADYINIISRIDFFTVCIGRFYKCLELDEKKPKKTPLNNLWRYFCFFRDYFVMMLAFKVMCQLTAVFFMKTMNFDDISFAYIKIEFLRELLI